ncbi:sperm-associated antigen 4 protein-like isoform X3 [Tympanuchus pallidicinctus]|nr:sperm-associated antigen 4 protein-like isoform X3 [Tympanuchus pallidicinctus]
MNRARVFVALSLVLLVAVATQVYFTASSWIRLKIEEDTEAQRMLSELRARQECYQTPDWARKSIGATIDLHRTSPTYTFKCWFCWLHSLIVPVNPPDTILQPGDSPGQCWPMEGHQGQVVIGLPAEIVPSCVILEHVDPGLTPAASPSSAPKEFAVFGLDVDSEEEVPLGSFTFDVQKAFLDIFLLQNHPARAFRHIKVLVDSNWGHPEYTCIYRVQVHGKVVKKLTV